MCFHEQYLIIGESLKLCFISRSYSNYRYVVHQCIHFLSLSQRCFFFLFNFVIYSFYNHSEYSFPLTPFTYIHIIHQCILSWYNFLQISTIFANCFRKIIDVSNMYYLMSVALLWHFTATFGPGYALFGVREPPKHAAEIQIAENLYIFLPLSGWKQYIYISPRIDPSRYQQKICVLGHIQYIIN